MRFLIVPCAFAVVAAASGAHADPEAARHLANECVTCHVPTGDGEGIPNIVGLPKDTFIAAFNEYRMHERDHALMNTIASRYEDDEVKALAAHFADLGESSSE
jgi:cytochrome c553